MEDFGEKFQRVRESCGNKEIQVRLKYLSTDHNVLLAIQSGRKKRPNLCTENIFIVTDLLFAMITFHLQGYINILLAGITFVPFF